MALTLTAYAARRGCSVKSVSIAASSGRLVESVGRDERGRPVILDPELADREWTANTRRRADAPTPSGPRVTRPATAFAAEVNGVPVGCDTTEAAILLAKELAASPANGTQAAPAEVPPFNKSRDLRAAAAARREAAQADLAELELAAKRGEVVDAERARADVIERYTTIKTRLLAIPSALGQRLPSLAAQVVPAADELVRAALLELATGKIADDGDGGA